MAQEVFLQLNLAPSLSVALWHKYSLGFLKLRLHGTRQAARLWHNNHAAK